MTTWATLVNTSAYRTRGRGGNANWCPAITALRRPIGGTGISYLTDRHTVNKLYTETDRG